MTKGNRHALILAGGLGTRLWPRSRYDRPKQFLRLDCEDSLLELTLNRIRPLFKAERIWIVTRPSQQRDVLKMFPEIRPENVLVEPCAKGTGAAIAWAGLVIEAREPGAVVSVFPSDHLIKDEERFRQILRAGIIRAKTHREIVIFGIRPSRPETEFGYIEAGDDCELVMEEPCYRVLGFHEKPDKGLAQDYVSSGRFFWNSGIFIFHVQSLTRYLKQLVPSMWLQLQRLIKAFHAGKRLDRLARIYSFLPPESIDKILLEKMAGRAINGRCDNACGLAMFPCDFEWYDLGIWETYYSLMEKDRHGNALDGLVVAIGCENSLLSSREGTLVAAIGLNGIAVVAEGDAVLICPRDRLEEVRDIVNKIRQKGLKKYL